MPLPMAEPGPVIANPATMRAAAALPAAGAWDAAPTEVACAGYEWMRLYFTYTRAEQIEAGAVAFRYEISPYYADLADVEDWFQGTFYAPNPLTPCEDICSEVQREFLIYCATSNDAETFISAPIHLAGCVERIRIPCREYGDVDNPGECHIVALFNIEG